MNPHEFVTQLAESEGLRSTVEAIATSSKVTTGAILGNGFVLAAVNTEVLTGYLALFSTIASALTLGIIAVYWIIKTAREWKALQREDK